MKLSTRIRGRWLRWNLRRADWRVTICRMEAEDVARALNEAKADRAHALAAVMAFERVYGQDCATASEQTRMRCKPHSDR